MTGVLKQRYPEYIIVMERMNFKTDSLSPAGRHGRDIKTGFDFAAVKRVITGAPVIICAGNGSSGGRRHRSMALARTELLPIKKTAEGVASMSGNTLPSISASGCRKTRARLVRYSKASSRVGTRFAWGSPGAWMWRSKLGAFCQSFASEFRQLPDVSERMVWPELGVSPAPLIPINQAARVLSAGGSQGVTQGRFG